MLRFTVFIICLLFTQLYAADSVDKGANSKVIKTSTPEWVRDITFEPTGKTPKEGTRNGVYYLCSDFQVHIEKAQEYGHYAYRFLNTTGLEKNSQLSFKFDPEYQTLHLHRLIIHRDGKKLDRLAETEVRVIEQESGHERQLYDGSKTALVILKDVRVGDVLEYAYTYTGRNPVFGKHYASFQSLAFNVTVAKMYKRFIWDPKIRTLRHNILNTDTTITNKEDGGMQELEWSMENTPATKRDTDTPDWYLTTPTLQLTDYASWDEFGDWARPLYRIGNDLPKPLKAECERIRKLPSDSERVMAALQFVQTNIRYLGSFMGTHSHEPYPVKTIYERRFGDCKDKSIILCTMLKQLGYDAVPALVDTDDRKAIKDFLPGHFNFDHVIVHLKLNGDTYWLDGTRTLQCGELKDLYIPDYGFAFVINDFSKGLTALKPRGFDVKKTIISEKFQVPDLSGKMSLRVTTTATGADANYLRDYFSSNSIKEITESYQKFYSEAYPEITAKPVSYTDDKQRNMFVVHERYEITDFWTEDESDSDQMIGWFEAKSVYQKIDTPSSPIRTMPYAIYHPVNTYHTVFISMPDDWNFSSIDRNIDNEAFRFTSSSEVTSKTLKLHYHYLSKQDHVPIASLKSYIKDCDNAENDTFYQLSYSKSLMAQSMPSGEKSDSLSIILMLSIGCAALLSSLIAVFIYHYDPMPRPTVEPEYLHGLSGWLVPVGINLCLTPFLLLGIFDDINDYFSGSFLSDMLGNNSGIEVIITFVVLSSYTFFIPVSILMISLFFMKRSSFPLLFIIVLIASLLVDTFCYILVLSADGLEQSDIDPYLTSVVYDSVMAVAFIPYLLLSKRVRNTFRQSKNVYPAPSSTPPSSPLGPPPLPNKFAPKPGVTIQDLGAPPILSPPTQAAD